MPNGATEGAIGGLGCQNDSEGDNKAVGCQKVPCRIFESIIFISGSSNMAGDHVPQVLVICFVCNMRKLKGFYPQK